MSVKINPKKIFFAKLLCALKLDLSLLTLQRLLYRNNFIRAINYHCTPDNYANLFEKHLQFYQEHFTPVSLPDLENFFATNRWKKGKPGLIISFDDGSRSNYEVALALLEKYGFIGWFFVPTNFIGSNGTEGICRYKLWYMKLFDHQDGRLFMNWQELRELDQRGHVIGSHTRNHWRLVRGTRLDQLEEEIRQSKADLEQRLQHEITVFCWVGGEEYTYSATAAQMIRQSGYRYGFMTCSAPICSDTNPYQLKRTNVEACYPLEVVKFQLSGCLDVSYYLEGRRINRLTA